MRSIVIRPQFDAWRVQARELLLAGLHPSELIWSDQAAQPSLFDEVSGEKNPAPSVSSAAVSIPAAFMDLARTVAAHTHPERWAVLYRLLWRLTHGGERHLLTLPTDADVRRAEEWAKPVRREIHKMHAFVRFRLIGHDQATGREQFVAWFEPLYHTVRLGAGFFQRRFAGMDWSILTPDECAHWDGQTLHFTPGVTKDQAPNEDALDDLWRSYYKSIFNPARLKIKMMQTEMPKKYWKNLPEASLIDELIQTSTERVQTMLATPERPLKPAPKNAYLRQLHQMNGLESAPKNSSTTKEHTEHKKSASDQASA
jgi:uracil-DNA glycosylase